MFKENKLIRLAFATFKEIKSGSLNTQKWDIRSVIWPFRMLFHPVLALNEIKYEKKGSVLLSLIILLLVFVGNVYKVVETGFIFNYYRVDDVNIPLIIAQTFLPVILWTLCVMAVSTFLEGEGSLKDVFVTVSYSLMPSVITQIPLTIASKFLSVNEEGLFSIAHSVVTLWIFILLFMSNLIINQYNLKKNLLSMLFSAFGMGIIIFLFVLTFSLFQQLFTFLSTIVSEILFRL